MLLHYSEQTSCILSRVSPAPAPRLVLRDNSAFFSMVKECMCLFVRFCWRCVALHILTHPLQQHDPVMYCVYTFWCLHIHHLLNSDKHTHDMCQNWLRGLSFFCFVQRDVSYGSHSKQQVFYSTWGWGPRPPSFTLSLLWAHCSVLGKANKQNEMLFSSCSPLGAMDFMIFVSLEKKKIPYPLRSSWTALLTGQLFLSTVTAMTEFFRGWRGPNRWTLPTCCVAGSVVFVGQQNTWWLSATF